MISSVVNRENILGGVTPYTPPTYSAGGVIFAGPGGAPTVDATNFVYDDTNDFLRVPTIIGGTGVDDDLKLRATSGVGTVNSRIFLEVGSNGAIQAVEVKRDSGGNFGQMGIGTPGNFTVDCPLCVFGTGADLGYLIKARGAGGTPNAFTQMQTAANANAQAGFSFYQRQNDVEWVMAVVGNDGDAMRWQAIITGSGTTVFYATKTFNVILDSTRSDPASGSKVLVIGDGTAPGNLASNTAAFFANDVSGTVQMFVKNEANEVNQISGDIIIASGKYFYTQSASFMIRGLTSYTDGAGALTGTLTNSPVTGNPTKWIPIDDNGVTRYIPAW